MESDGKDLEAGRSLGLLGESEPEHHPARGVVLDCCAMER